MELDQLKKKKLKKLVDLAEKGQVALVDQIDELENKLDEGLSTIQESIDTQISAVSEELKKKLESELVLEIDKEELIGEKGADGRNPMFVGNNPPTNPQIGDLWYQN